LFERCVTLIALSAMAVSGTTGSLLAQTRTAADTGACPAPDARRSDSAGTRTPDSARSGPRAADTDRRPTIALLVSASAREIRFASQPNIVVRRCGGAGDSVRVLERRNLPERIEPGVTYRDVYIAVEILGHLNAACILQRAGVADTSRVGTVPSETGDPCASIQLRDSIRTTPGDSAPP
jgi:hypothetical protein